MKSSIFFRPQAPVKSGFSTSVQNRILCWIFVLAFTCYHSVRGEIDSESKRVLNSSRERVEKLDQGENDAALGIIREVENALKRIDPSQDDKSLYAWYHGNRTILKAQTIRLDEKDKLRSLAVAKEMVTVADRALLPSLKVQRTEKYVLMLEEKASALLEVACFSFYCGKPDSKSSFVQSMDILHEALNLAGKPIDKARIYDHLGKNYAIAAETHLAADGPDGITPKTLGKYCGESITAAVSNTRTAVDICSKNSLEAGLVLFRCNLMMRLEHAHYWRTNRPLASNSDEYIEGVEQLRKSLPYARLHPDDSDSMRLIEYYNISMKLPQIEAGERWDKFKKLVEPMINESPLFRYDRN